MLLTVPQAGRLGMFLVTLVQVFPPSRVTWTRPSFVPAQMQPFSSGDSAMAKTTQPYSTARLSRVSPPDGPSLFGIVGRQVGADQVPAPAGVGRPWTYWLPT